MDSMYKYLYLSALSVVVFYVGVVKFLIKVLKAQSGIYLLNKKGTRSRRLKP